MTTRMVQMERFSLTASKPFETVLVRAQSRRSRDRTIEAGPFLNEETKRRLSDQMTTVA
jgi:hypothetical protein